MGITGSAATPFSPHSMV